MPRTKKKSQFLFAMGILLLATAASRLVAQPVNCYNSGIEPSGFDVAPYQADLALAACELAASFPDSLENQFKVFSFGFYVNLEFYDQFSYPQAFLEMKSRIATQSPYFLLIGRQTDHKGVFTRFWVDFSLPTTSIFSCAYSEQLEVLKTRVLVAMESNYSRNGRSASYYAEAETNGMNELKAYVLSQYDCCGQGNRGNVCDDCASFSALSDFLEWAGYTRTAYPSGLSYSLATADNGFLRQDVQVNLLEDGVLHDLNQEVRQFLDSINSFISPVKAEITMYNSLSCLAIFGEQEIAMDDEYLKFKVILAFDDDNVPNLFINSRFKLAGDGTTRKVLVSLPFGGHGLDLNTLKAELINFIELGGCTPTVVVKSKIIPLDWSNNDYLIIVGKNVKQRIQNLIMNEYCKLISHDFESDLQKWVNYRGLIGYSDGKTKRIAVVATENMNLSKYNVQTKEKAAAFVAYHELGHLTLGTTHGGEVPFVPVGFMDVESGIYHVLGTGTKLNEHPEWFGLYQTLEELITDPKKKFGPKILKYPSQLCGKLKE
jgi:hypothetical protein